MSSPTTVIASRLEELSIAAQLHNAGAQLRRWTDNSYLGIILIIAGLPMKGPTDWVSIGLGFLLFFETYYLKWKLQLPILDTTVFTIAVVVFWHGINFTVRPTVVSKIGFILLIGILAFSQLTSYWKPRRRYKSLLQKVNPAAVGELESLLKIAEAGNPLVLPELSEYRIRGFLRGGLIWRLVRSGDLLLFVKNTKIFENLKFAVECYVVEKKGVQFNIDEISSGTNAKVTLCIGPEHVHHAALPSSMVEKLQGTIMGRA